MAKHDKAAAVVRVRFSGESGHSIAGITRLQAANTRLRLTHGEASVLKCHENCVAFANASL